MARAGSSGSPSRPSGNLLFLGELAHPFGPRLRRILSRFEAALPLSGIDKAEQNRIHANARRELGRQRFQQILHAGSGRRGAHHVRLRLHREQRIDRDDCRPVALFQKRKESADRQNLAEEFQVQFLAPLRVGGVRKRRNAALAGIVDEEIDAGRRSMSQPFARNRLTASASSTLQVSASRALPGAPSFCFAAARRAASRPQIATRAPSASRYFAVARPMPELPPVTTATLFLRPRSTTVLAPAFVQAQAFRAAAALRAVRPLPFCGSCHPSRMEISRAASSTAVPICARRSSPSN